VEKTTKYMENQLVKRGYIGLSTDLSTLSTDFGVFVLNNIHMLLIYYSRKSKK
jgi:hypothetical protein